MSIADKKGISVTSGFKLISGQPLDARLVVDDLDGLQDLINNGAAYEGIVVYVKSEQQLKQYNGSEWDNVYPESDIITVNPLPNIENAKLDKIYRVPKIITSGTALPNTGTVGEIHFNTTLTIKQVEDILNELTFTGEVYLVLAASDESPVIVIYKHTDPEGMVIMSESGSGVLWANEGAKQNYASRYGITHAGWQSFTNPIVLNEEVKATSGGAPVGTQNGLLLDLIFTAPFSETMRGFTYYRADSNNWIEVLNEGSSGGSLDFVDVEELPPINYAVPNFGYVEKIYLNKNLSTEEMVSIFERVIPKDKHANIWYSDTENVIASLIVTYYSNTDKWNIFIEGNYNGGYIWDSQNGWLVDYNEIALNTYNNSATLPNVTTLNDQLSDIFAIKPFGTEPEYELDKIYRTPENKIINGTAVPNSGTINNLYFNTSLNDEEIKKIINQLQFIDGTSLGQAGVEFYPILAYMNGYYPYVLGFQRYTAGEYAGIVNLFILNFATMESVYNFYVEVYNGWQAFENPYPMNVTVLSELSGIPIGYQNELLKMIISAAPFEKELVGYNYKRVINGEWVEVLKEQSKIIIEVPQPLEAEGHTFTNEQLEAMAEDKVILRFTNNLGLSHDLQRVGFTDEGYIYGNIVDMVGYQICYVDYTISKETKNIARVINQELAVKDPNIEGIGRPDLTQDEKNITFSYSYLSDIAWRQYINLPKATTITDSTDVPTASAVKNYVDEKVSSSGGGGSSDFVNVEELPEASSADLNKVYRVSQYDFIGTEVSSSGLIEKVYINNNLSDAEILEILESIELISVPGFSYPLYGVTLTADFSNAIVISKENGTYFLTNTINGETYGIWTSAIGWVDKTTPITIGYENMLFAVASQLGASNQNSKLKNLISSTLFEKILKGYKYYRIINSEWIEVLNEVNPTYIIEKDYNSITNNTLTFTASEWEIIRNNHNVKLYTKNVIEGIGCAEALFEKAYYLKTTIAELVEFQSSSVELLSQEISLITVTVLRNDEGHTSKYSDINLTQLANKTA